MKKMKVVANITESISAAVVLLLTFAIVSSAQAQTGAYTVNGGTATQTGQSYTATNADQSAVYVLNSGNLTLTNCTIMKTGDAASVDKSNQYGLNAGLLASSASKVTITGGSVTTNASGGNGLFATGSGSAISMSGGTINASGGGAHGVDVTYGGSITLTNVDITTTGASSSALATDFGGGTVTVTGGTISASNTAANGHSAGIYSTGNITVTGATVASLGDCGGVIDGANSISLTNTALTGALEGIKTWKTAPMSGTATVTINGGSLTAKTGAAFYVTGETGNAATASFTARGGATISAGSGNLINVIKSSTASFTADGETLTGNLITDATSKLTASLQNSTSLTGYINTAALTIDATSTWTVTVASYLTTLANANGISGLTVTNIIGNGNNVYYDASFAANSYLGSKTYSLVNGGSLLPKGTTSVNDEQSSQPTDWMLGQNYPNPFWSGATSRSAGNPATTISYLLPIASEVKLVVYDVDGHEVAVLVAAKQSAGTYEVTFDASQLSSGAYFYQLRAGSFVATKEMLLVR